MYGRLVYDFLYRLTWKKYPNLSCTWALAELVPFASTLYLITRDRSSKFQTSSTIRKKFTIKPFTQLTICSPVLQVVLNDSKKHLQIRNKLTLNFKKHFWIYWTETVKSRWGLVSVICTHWEVEIWHTSYALLDLKNSIFRYELWKKLSKILNPCTPIEIDTEWGRFAPLGAQGLIFQILPDVLQCDRGARNRCPHIGEVDFSLKCHGREWFDQKSCLKAGTEDWKIRRLQYWKAEQHFGG